MDGTRYRMTYVE